MPYVSGRYVNYAYTYTECKEMVEICKQAVKDLMSGQAQEYTIGSRNVKFINVDDAQDWLNYFVSELRKYEMGTRPGRSVAVVPRN